MAAVILIFSCDLGHAANDAKAVLKGKLITEDGILYLVLQAPIEEDGQVIHRVQIDNPSDDIASSQGGIFYLFGNRTGSVFSVARALPADASQPGNNPSQIAAEIRSLFPDQPAASDANIGVNREAGGMSPMEPAGGMPNYNGNAEPSHNASGTGISAVDDHQKEMLQGKWSTKIGAGSLSGSGSFGIGLSLDMTCHVVIDLGKDQQALLTFGPEGGTVADGIIGLNVIGEWFIGKSSQGRPLLVIRPRESYGQKRLTRDVQGDVSFYILHISEDTLVLDDGGMRLVMNRQ